MRGVRKRKTQYKTYGGGTTTTTNVTRYARERDRGKKKKISSATQCLEKTILYNNNVDFATAQTCSVKRTVSDSDVHVQRTASYRRVLRAKGVGSDIIDILLCGVVREPWAGEKKKKEKPAPKTRQ